METGAGAVAIGPRAFSQVPGGFGAPPYMMSSFGSLPTRRWSVN